MAMAYPFHGAERIESVRRGVICPRWLMSGLRRARLQGVENFGEAALVLLLARCARHLGRVPLHALELHRLLQHLLRLRLARRLELPGMAGEPMEVTRHRFDEQ